MSKFRVLYIQVPNGGGSLFAMYEMLKRIDRSLIEPVILCYEKNKHTTILQNLQCSVTYLYEASEADANKKLEVDTTKSVLLRSIKKEIFSLYRYYKRDKPLVKQLKKIIANANVQLVHHNNDVALNRYPIKATSQLGIPQILHNRSLKRYIEDRLNFVFDYFLIRKVKYQINISEAVQKHFCRIFHLSPQNKIVVRDIVDTEKFIPTPIDKNLLNSFGFEANDVVITNIGRVIEWKGQDVFIKAMQQVVQQIPNAKALIVGGYEVGVGNPDFYLELQHLVQQLNLTNNIVFTGNRKDITAIINSSTMVVHTATTPEPQGLVILEAMFCNKPVIVSNAGGAAELANRYGALPTTPGNVNELATAIIDVIQNTEQHTKRQQRYKQLLQEDFISKKQIEQIQSVYQQILPNYVS